MAYQTDFYIADGGDKPVQKNRPGRATFSIGAEATNVITVAVQLQDAGGVDLAQRGAVYGYLSSDANGDSLATAPSGGVAAGTDGLLIEAPANQGFWMISENDGDIDVAITDTSTPTFYLAVILPDGSLVVSGAITFA
jgi:hypothetical protein